MTKKSFESAEIVVDEDGRYYHIGCKEGDLNPYILLCGDPARAYKTAKYFDDARTPITHREYVTVSGNYKGIPVSVMATGIGADNTEIALVEAYQIVKQPTFIRIGTSGGLKKDVGLGDLVISTGAVRLENTSTHFVLEGYPAVAHYECVGALVEAASRMGVTPHVGLTATTPGFYGAQARRVPGFPPRDPELPAKLDQMNVINFEMEASCLFILGSLAGFRTGAVCTVLNNRHKNIFVDTDVLAQGEKRCIEVGLGALSILAEMDNIKGRRKE